MSIRTRIQRPNHLSPGKVWNTIGLFYSMSWCCIVVVPLLIANPVMLKLGLKLRWSVLLMFRGVAGLFWGIWKQSFFQRRVAQVYFTRWKRRTVQILLLKSTNLVKGGKS